MEDLRLALMCGVDIPIPSLQLVAHQPKIKEIALMGETDFFIAVQCLSIDKNFLNQDKSLLQDTNNFQKIATQKLFSLLFPNYSVLFTPRSIMLQKEAFSVMIDENNFNELQEIAKQIFCIANKNNQQANFNPADERARQIAEKLMRGRKRVAEQNGSANASIFSQYLSILTVGLSSTSLQELMELTMFQLYDLIERYQLYISWDIDIRSRMAGAKPEDKPDNWMKNIH